MSRKHRWNTDCGAAASALGRLEALVVVVAHIQYFGCGWTKLVGFPAALESMLPACLN